MSIGQRISELRKESGLSQEYVAEKIGVSRQAVSKWENDTTAPDTYNLIALAEMFDVSVEYIATGKKAEPSQTVQPQIIIQQQEQPSEANDRRAVGFILLWMGILTFILGILFAIPLVLLSSYLIIGGIVCIVAKKNYKKKIILAYLLLTLIIVFLFTRGIKAAVVEEGTSEYVFEYQSVTEEIQ